MYSNHTLTNLGVREFIRDNDGDVFDLHSRDEMNDILLFESLRLNMKSNKSLVVRRKIFWSHILGDLNIEEFSIVASAIPCALAWFGNGSNETRVNIFQCNNLQGQHAVLGAARLDAIYRILRSSGILFNEESRV